MINILSIFTFIGQIFAVALLIMLISGKGMKLVKKYGFIVLLLSACGATLGSLYFSEIADLLPCRLCWFQRILMYPQAVLLIIAAIAKEGKIIVKYILALSVIGILFSGYQYYGQIGAILNSPAVTAGCDVSGASCSSTPFLSLNYITIPMMALTVFLINILLSSLIMRANKNK